MSDLVDGSERYSTVEHKGDDSLLKCGNLRLGANHNTATITTAPKHRDNATYN